MMTDKATNDADERAPRMIARLKWICDEVKHAEGHIDFVFEMGDPIEDALLTALKNTLRTAWVLSGTLMREIKRNQEPKEATDDETD